MLAAAEFECDIKAETGEGRAKKSAESQARTKADTDFISTDTEAPIQADFSDGSFATETRCPHYVRFSFDSDHIADASPRLKCANSGSDRPKAEHGAEWQAAMRALLLVAEHDGPAMFARIGVIRALNRHVERVFNPSRKDKHWGRRKLARDR